MGWGDFINFGLGFLILAMYKAFLRYVLVILSVLAVHIGVWAQGPQVNAVSAPVDEGPVKVQTGRPIAAADTMGQVTISLLTADPGPEIFELYGHEAVRVVMADGTDMVYNYGLFDFNSPGFVVRFVKGATDYMAGYMPTWAFVESYRSRGSKIVEQELNLSEAEKARFLELLNHDVDPEYREYRYKYCTNNCATRILDGLEKAIGQVPAYADAAPELTTYRDVMRYYNRNYDWYQFGIDLALGSYIDRDIDAREKLFVPVLMRKGVDTARLGGGKAIVAGSERVILEGVDDATLPPTCVLLSPMAAALLLLVITGVVVVRDVRRGALTRFWYSFCCVLFGLMGIVVWFLAFISEHEGASPNILVWWLSPVSLVVGITLWCGRLRTFNRVLMVIVDAGTCVTFVALILGVQGSNAAFYPLMLTNMLLVGAYLRLTAKPREGKAAHKTTK